MSTLAARMTGRRVATDDADRRKKLLLVGLLIVLAGLFAFELPMLLKRSGSSSSTASPPVATTAAPSAASAGVAPPVASAPTSAPAQRERAIRRMTPRDPFVPVVSESAPAPGPSSAPTSTPAPASSSAPTSAPASARSSAPTSAPPSASSSAPTSAPTPQPTSHITPRTDAPATSASTEPAAVKPAPVRPAEPTAAVIRTNGQRRIVGVRQTFRVGDATFKLAAVKRTAMRLQVADGSFTGGKRTITILKGHRVILENNATGVRYTLRFAGGITDAPTVHRTDATNPSNPSGTGSSAPSGTKSTSNRS
jgi:hypothetical protein